MPTLAQAVKNFLQSAGSNVTSEQVKQAIFAEYPDQWKQSSLQAHLYACAVNNPKAYIHHPFAERFLFRNADGTFELYVEDKHGPNVWDPGNEIAEVEELVDASISFERGLETHLASNLGAIEKGLKFLDRQVNTEVGRIDILAEDSAGTRVVIELKVGEAKDSSIGQIARYLGWYAKLDGKAPRGLLIAAEFSKGIRYAAAAIPNLTLLEYKVQFSFERAVS